jgi:hypothetical protein
MWSEVLMRKAGNTIKMTIWKDLARTGICILALVMLLGVSACSNSQQKSGQDSKTAEGTKTISSGLILGLAKEKGADTTSPMEIQPAEYRTLWVRHSGSAVVSEEKKGYILTPYKDKFWILENRGFNLSAPGLQPGGSGSVFSKYGSYYNFSNIISYLAGEKGAYLYTEESFKKKYLHSGEGYIGENYKTGLERLVFAGNKYACVINDYYETGGGSYQAGKNEIMLFDIDSLGILENRNNSIRLVDLLDGAARDKLNEYPDKYNKVLDTGSNFREEQLADIQNLSLGRAEGKWQVRVPLFKKYEHYGNGCTSYTVSSYFESDIVLPRDIISHDTLCIDWNTIKQKIPQARDAVSSPEKDMLAVLTPSELLIYTDPEKGMEKPALSIAVDSSESIVLNQWATGEYVDIWDKVVSGLH